MVIKQAKLFREQVIALLASEKLPLADLPENLINFLVVTDNDETIGVIGFETHGDYGLLRSLAVKSSHRSKRIAANLIANIEAIAISKGLTALYLLTETAENYFKNKGFTKIYRDDVPPEIQLSSEFSHMCPASAIVMKKQLTK